jgi:hypothetical protein
MYKQSCGVYCTAAKVASSHGYHLVFLHIIVSQISKTSLPLNHYNLPRSHISVSCLSGVVVLDPPLAIGVHEAGAAPGALSRAATADTRGAVATKHAAEAEQDGGDEEACERGPGEAEQVAADAGIKIGGAEGVAALDDPCAVPKSVRCQVRCDAMGKTYVSREAARAWKNRAMETVRPDR